MKLKTLVAACSLVMQATDDTQYLVLIPEGTFKGADGRPTDAPHWVLTPERGQQIVAALNQRGVDMVIDYDHATLDNEQKQQGNAPASGWLKAGGFTYVEGVGVCSENYQWTDKAQAAIAANEYKYLSPVLYYTATGEVVGLHSSALTNKPNLDLPQAKLAALSEEFLSTDSSMNEELLERLRWMLNLPITATAEDISAELEKLKAQLAEKSGVTIAANGQHLFDALAALDGRLAANAEFVQIASIEPLTEFQPDPNKWVPMAVYQEALQQGQFLAANAEQEKFDQVFTAACSDGRLTGQATIEWVKQRAQTDVAGTIAYIEGLPKIAALTQQQSHTLNIAANKQQGQQFTPEDLAVAQAMGVQLGADA